MKRLLACCLLLAVPLLAPAQQPNPLPTSPINPGFPTPGVAGRPDFKELTPVLIDALRDRDAEVRQSAASALASIGHPAIEPLLDVLKDKEQSKEMRANAAYVLGQMGPSGQEALPALTKALKDDDKEIRRRAAFAIQRIVKELGVSGHMGGGMPMPGMMMGGRATTTSPDVKVTDPGLLAPSGETRPTEKPREEKKEEKKEDTKEEKK
jgi:hypothetical protein